MLALVFRVLFWDYLSTIWLPFFCCLDIWCLCIWKLYIVVLTQTIDMFFAPASCQAAHVQTCIIFAGIQALRATRPSVPNATKCRHVAVDSKRCCT